MNYWPIVWDDIRRIINDVWPEIGLNFRSVVSRRQNWLNNVLARRIPVPYAIIHAVPSRESEEYGMDNVVYQPYITVYYFTDNPGNTPSGATPGLEERLMAFQDRLLHPNGLLQHIQIMGELEIDVSETNDVNAQIVDDLRPFLAGGIGFRILVGENAISTV